MSSRQGAMLERRGKAKAVSSSILLHTQLSNIMREKIQQREWSAGDKIPSEHELMSSFGLSRGTVRRAIKTLADEGLVVQMHGRGTFVAEQGIAHTSGQRLLSFAGSLQKQGKPFTTRVLDMRVLPADERVAAELSIPVGRDVLFLRRVRIVSGAPAFYHESWLNLSECPGLDQVDFAVESAFDAVERCSGHKIRFSRMSYSAARAGRDRAYLLECAENDSILVLEQLISLDDHVPVEWSLTWLAPDQAIIGGAFQPNGGIALAGLGERPDATGVKLPVIPAADAREIRPAKKTRQQLERAALDIRRQVVEFAHNDADLPFHVGGSFSIADILAVLYGDVMRVGVDGTPWDHRDRLVLSKAHASLALYPALAASGLVSDEDLAAGLFGPGAVLFKHPKRDVGRGLEMSGGSLGMGMGYAAGLALAAKQTRRQGRVFCIVGDGECNEGAIWESAAFVGHNRLSNFTLIVDANGMQLDAPTSEVLDTEPVGQKFAAFGFQVVDVDGHDVNALREALAVRTDRPRAIIAHTIKGKGLSFTESQVSWHDWPVTDELYEQALSEFAAAEADIDARADARHTAAR